MKSETHNLKGNKMSEYILIREVGLRDGLQLINTRLDTKTKQKWLEHLINAGVKEIEISSIVPRKLLPQFSDAIEMISFANKFTQCEACILVPNFKGFKIAFQANAKKIIFVISASEAHNLANVNMTLNQSFNELRKIIYARNSNDDIKGIKLIGSISTSFGCSISGKISEKKVLGIMEKMLEMGVDEISIADTVGYANPRYVSSLFKKVIQISKSLPIIGHFHDTRGFGLANVVAAVDEGVKIFDSSLRGLGGCPYAPGASGNIATEDCINLLESMGFKTGVNLEKLLLVCKLLESWLPNEMLHGKFLSSVNISKKIKRK